MPVPENQLSDILISVRHHTRAIAAITLLCGLIGVAFSLAAPKRYAAHCDFVVRNPLYGDRSNLYANDARFLDYFAGEDDLDKLIMLSESDIVIKPIIRKFGLAGVYKTDTTTRSGSRALEKRVQSKLGIRKNEYRGLTLKYVDTDPTRAAAVANEAVVQLENAISSFYSEMRQSALDVIQAKIHEEDSAINSLTDTLARLRAQYGIYDIISPTRHNIMVGTIKSNGKPGYERAIEEIQNIESIKDEVVSHRALQTTLANQYSAALGKGRLPLLKVITPAKNNMAPMLTSPIIVVICALAGLFFSILAFLIRDHIAGRSKRSSV